MHSYSIDSDIRKHVYVGLAAVALLLPSAIEDLRTFLGISESINFSLSFGLIFGAEYWLFNNYLWKILAKMKQIPDLSGKWRAKGISSYKGESTGQNIEYTMDITIKQTFSKIEVFAKTDTSTSKSFMASIEQNHAVPIFSYAYNNEPMSIANEELQRHPGLISLRIESNKKMEGDYFSGKHRLRYGTLILTRRK